MNEAAAIIPAAGMGVRLGLAVPKALVQVAGRTLLDWCLFSLDRSGVVADIVVSVPPGAIPVFQEATSNRAGVRFTEGGRSRQESVHAALGLIAPGSKVLIHDAARCFAGPDLIRRVVDSVDLDHPAVVPGLPVSDTIKVVDSGEPAPVVATPDRTSLRAIQTPQGFLTDVVLEAHQKFREAGLSEATAATDDAQLIEWMGLPTFVCEGDESAFKVTTKSDLELAERWVNANLFDF